MIHKHHIKPKHMGGTDDPSNIVELTLQEHADAHNLLFCLHGKVEDQIAERMLCGIIPVAEAVRLAQIQGNKTRVWTKESSKGISQANRERIFSKEDRLKKSESAKKMWKNPKTREAILNHVAKRWSNPENRKAQSKAISGFKNGKAKSANVYNYETKELVAENVVLSAYCKEHGLSGSHLSSTTRGLRNHHRGLYAVYT